MTTSEDKRIEIEEGKLREHRIREIEEKGPGKNWHKILYQGDLKEFPVYKIPLDALIYNKYNGRILSETKAMESLGSKILAHTQEGKETIEDLLWESRETANERTLKSLTEHGQEKIAVISKDGVVIDGNRRTMLLNKIEKYDHLEAIILPLSSYEDSLEIENIETQIQMGGDKAIDYDPIQIYLKIQSMYNQMDPSAVGLTADYENDNDEFIPKFDKDNKNDKAVKKIYANIGTYKTISKESDIEFFLKVMDTMDEYLYELGIPEAYPALDGREEQFRGLTTSLGHFYGENSARPFKGYSDFDVDDYKILAFDLIRLKQKNEDFRVVGGKQRETHIIGDEDRWKSFLETHNEIVKLYSEDEFDGDSDPKAIRNILSSRDSDFKKEVFDDVNENFKVAVGKVENKKHADMPGKLVEEAKGKLKAINLKHANVRKKEVQNSAKELVKEGIKILGEKGQSFILKQAIAWLKKVTEEKEDVLNDIDQSNKESILKSLTDIQKLSYRATKIVKKV